MGRPFSPAAAQLDDLPQTMDEMLDIVSKEAAKDG
tara:strand:- start:427 stop:531 length:105 start_codon:yes stop_codon:yes gene_type:complete